MLGRWDSIGFLRAHADVGRCWWQRRDLEANNDLLGSDMMTYRHQCVAARGSHTCDGALDERSPELGGFGHLSGSPAQGDCIEYCP